MAPHAKPTDKKTFKEANIQKTNGGKECCKNAQKIIEQLLQRIERLEMQQSTTSEIVEHFTLNVLDQMNGLTDTVVKLDGAGVQQNTAQLKICKAVQENSERIQALGHDLKKAEQAIASVADRQEELAAGWVSTQEKLQNVTINSTQSKSTDGNAFFLGGIQTLKKFYQSPNADPAEIVHYLLKDLNLYCSMERCTIADGQARSAGDRMKARAVVIVMRSPHHKKEAIVCIKRYLGECNVKNVTVSDTFPTNKMERVKILSRIAQKEKNDKKIVRYRVVNKGGNTVLQTQRRNKDTFKDVQLTDDQIASFVGGSLVNGPTPIDTNQLQKGLSPPAIVCNSSMKPELEEKDNNSSDSSKERVATVDNTQPLEYMRMASPVRQGVPSPPPASVTRNKTNTNFNSNGICDRRRWDSSRQQRYNRGTSRTAH